MKTDTPDVILVADDDPAVRVLFRRGLERAGFRVVEAADGHAALAAAREPGVALALLDSSMPGLDGPEVARRLRELPSTRTLPILLVTGHEAIEERVSGLASGANDYLIKPVDLSELVARVQAQLRSQEAWSAAVMELEQRAVLSDVLRVTPRGLAATETATVLCHELCARYLGGAAVVSLVGRSARVLASAGDLAGLLESDADLGLGQARWLNGRSRQGPWSEVTGRAGSFQVQVLPDRLGPGILAGAPMIAGDVMLGAALVFDDASGARADRSGLSVATAIDLAAVAAVLMSAELLAEDARSEGREELGRLVAGGGFASHFQPVVDLGTGTVVGFEALTRFGDGERPDLRFAAAHRLDLGVELERVTAVAAIREGTRLPSHAWLSINASSAVLSADEEFWSILARASQPIVVEVTEHEPVDDYARLKSAFARARPEVRMAVDDAGTGYSSLRHILRLNPEFVKLDAEWVRDLDADPVRQALVAGIQHFAEVADCDLIAEGIETEAEVDTLRALGVGLGQGYLLGRPRPVGEIAGGIAP